RGPGSVVAARIAGAEDQDRVRITFHEGQLGLRPCLSELVEAAVAASVVGEVRTSLLPHELRRGWGADVERVYEARAAPRREIDIRLACGRILVRPGDTVEEIILRLRRRRECLGRVGELDQRAVRVEAL